jgi:tRNA-dihydrouridine synthase B
MNQSENNRASIHSDIQFVAAPMVGISHVAFRHLIRSYCPPGVTPLVFTEMLSTRKIPSEKLDVSNELKIADGESRFIPQLLGNEERFIGPSVAKLMRLNPWGFDINMGCPQSHILRHNWGVRLMGDRHYAADVVRMVKRHTDLPVSVKMRGGADKDVDISYLDEFTHSLEEAGADWITIHPRPRANKHEGTANWDVVKVIAAKRRIPVVANGDIQTADDALKMLTDYGAGGAMIARALTVRPWIFWQIAYKKGLAPREWNGVTLPLTDREEGLAYFQMLLRFIDFVTQFFAEDEDQDYALQKVRFFVATGSKWFLFGHSFWRYMMKAKTLEEMKIATRTYADNFSGVMYKRVVL